MSKYKHRFYLNERFFVIDKEAEANGMICLISTPMGQKIGPPMKVDPAIEEWIRANLVSNYNFRTCTETNSLLAVLKIADAADAFAFKLRWL